MNKPAGIRAMELFFSAPSPNGKLTLPEEKFYTLLEYLLSTDDEYLTLAWNTVARELGAKEFIRQLFSRTFEAFIKFGVMPQELDTRNTSGGTNFLMQNLNELLCALHRKLENLSDGLFPGLKEQILPQLDLHNALEQLRNADQFRYHRVFRWVGEKLHPVQPDAVKDPDKFFGFASVRHIYRDHFQDFADGKSNIPLLIYSLPGYGKTSMTISHALAASSRTVVILPDPEALQSSWLKLLDELKRRTDHQFVIFFDDIDPRVIDWYNFRTHVGGVFSLPPHIMPVLTSNYEFPAGILSRGRRVSYPVFDELRCTEMIEDFLVDFGLKRPPANLVSLIGADYTEEFGQKKFTELSPRTLMRYLQLYLGDRNKRRTIVELSMGELVTRPDAELFYEFNINLMRDLYGEEYIARLREEKLKHL